MEVLTIEQIEFAVAALKNLVSAREFTQHQLEHLSKVKQSQISKILSGQLNPSTETLKKLYNALGLKLEDILQEVPTSEDGELLGYLATPLTAVVACNRQNQELERIVEEIRRVALNAEFSNPRFNLYWPGEYTHPTKHPEFKSNQVYLTDRSRASTFDFIVIFCATPSYGVGQENEIATQAGLPAIRLLPPSISRMMSGSFLQAYDVQYSGTLDTAMSFDPQKLFEGLKWVRRICFKHRALYRSMNGNAFGDRLRKLLDDRSGDYRSFADDLGISFQYLDSLMREPFTVTNPSARLLNRMSILLNVSVGYLLGERTEIDLGIAESLSSWNSWIEKTDQIDAKIANRIKKDWQEEHNFNKKQDTVLSFRNANGVMREIDWDSRYQEALKAGKVERAKQTGLF